MSKLNIPRPALGAGGIVTHEGGPAVLSRSPFAQLVRLTNAGLLWEDNFYVDGQAVATQIETLVPQCNADLVAQLAIDLRTKGKLRHMPLLLLAALAKASKLRWTTVRDVIQRPDEMGELLAIIKRAETGPKMLRKIPNQVKKGLAAAFFKFDEYQFAKYNRDGAIKLRDVLFLAHPNPKDDAAKIELFKKIAEDKLATPDTWEVALSGGADKKTTFERLISENKLGSLALLRNLRNMQTAGVDKSLVEFALLRDAERTKALPFRYLAAVRACPQWADIIDPAMDASLRVLPRLPGKTCLLVDVSGSMNDPLSAKSDLRRLDAAMGLAILLRGICAEGVIATFSERVVIVPTYRGLALADAIDRSQEHRGTYLAAAVRTVNQQLPYDRIIVITDEQSQDGNSTPLPGKKGYLINVAAYQNSVAFGPWVSITGFSESVVEYIQAVEGEV